jgi:hypothetical protein
MYKYWIIFRALDEIPKERLIARELVLRAEQARCVQTLSQLGQFGQVDVGQGHSQLGC